MDVSPSNFLVLFIIHLLYPFVTNIIIINLVHLNMYNADTIKLISPDSIKC